MKKAGFHYCMLIGALSLAGVALHYLLSYFFTLSVALVNNSLEPALDHAIRAQWLAFAFQSLLIALLYVLVAFKPHAVTREVIVLLGLLQLVECVLLFAFSGSKVAAGLLIAASLFVLVGAAIWPKRETMNLAGASGAPAASGGSAATGAPSEPGQNASGPR